jgi:hypothetical protein
MCEKSSPVDLERELTLSSRDGEILLGWVPHSDAARECGSRLGAQMETVAPMPDTSWGGKRAQTANAQANYLAMQVRCVDGVDGVWVMVGIPFVTYEALDTAMDALSVSWVWKR